MRANQSLVNAMGGVASESGSFAGAEVIGLQEDGTVNVHLLGQDHIGLDAMSSYTNRAIGDVVEIRGSAGRWVVSGRVGASEERVAEIHWGYAAPVGAGWRTPVALFVREGELYAQVAGPAPPEGDDSLPVAQEPVPAKVTESYRGDYADGQLMHQPAQGVDPDAEQDEAELGAWRGAWFYGVELAAAINLRPVRYAEMRFERIGEEHGSPGLQVLEVYLHSQLEPTTDVVQFVGGPFVGPSLSLGASEWWRIPDEAMTLLANGAAAGFAVYTPVTGDYVVLTSTCGEIKIYN